MGFVRVGNGLDRSANLPIYWGGGTRKARDGGASHIKIHGRAWKSAPTTGRRVVAPYARITVYPFRNSQQILRREQAPALPCKMYFMRVEACIARSFVGAGLRARPIVILSR